MLQSFNALVPGTGEALALIAYVIWDMGKREVAYLLHYARGFDSNGSARVISMISVASLYKIIKKLLLPSFFVF